MAAAEGTSQITSSKLIKQKQTYVKYNQPP